MAALVALGLLAGVSVTVATAGSAPAQAAASAPTTLFVVDTSGSMYGERLDQAKSALVASVDALKPGQVAGMRTFSGGCGDGGALLTPLGADNRSQLKTDISSLEADGGTPTPDALRAAGNDLASVTGPKQIVLISDGESGCGDPCAVAAELAGQQGIGFTIHAVGFNAPDSAAAELSCIAEKTGGRYFSVTDSAGLASALGSVVGGSSPVQPCDKAFFIGLRGSGEAWDAKNRGMGDLINSVYAGINRPDGSVDVVNPEQQKKYRAAPLPSLPSLPTLPITSPAALRKNLASWTSTRDFATSSSTGTALALAQLRARIAMCGDKTRVVMAGYSQGAMATVDALQSMTSAERKKVVAVVLFGNPYYTPFVNGAVGPRNLPGLLGVSPPLPDGLPKRMQDYCNAHDPICSAPFNLWAAGKCAVTSDCSHYRYESTYRDKAVAFLKQKLA